MKKLTFQVELSKYDQLYIQDEKTFIKLRKRDMAKHIANFMLGNIPELIEFKSGTGSCDYLKTEFKIMLKSELDELQWYLAGVLTRDEMDNVHTILK